ncbi:MAG: hypothetical protein Q7U34_08655 [Anaerolineales bacterium]|nr:hypothetical protein [Anaerolineales bacterium]MDP3183862.1 hypothetical protein [Anaerolineales bacterium]
MTLPHPATGASLSDVPMLMDTCATGQFLLIGQPFGIMGRNILNAVALLLDGPLGLWEEQKG